MSLTIPSDHSSPTTSSYSLPLVIQNPPDPSLQESHANFSASPFLILYPIFLPFQPQRLLNSILLSPLPSINTPPYLLKTSIIRPDSYWYTISLLKQKRILLKAEKYYLKHPCPTSLAYYNNITNIYRKAISTAKTSHITHKFDKLSNDSKSIHRLSAQMLGRSLKAPLPTVTPEELPLIFEKSFNDKLSTTLSTLPTPVIPTTPITFPFFLDKFESPPLDQIISLLKSTSSTSSLDPLPLPILNQITNTVATPLHQIICGLLSSGSFPPDFKKQSSPLSLKSPTLMLCPPLTTDPSITSQSTLRSVNVLSPPNLSHTL